MHCFPTLTCLKGKIFLSRLTVCVCSLICWASKSENFVFLGDIVVLPTVTYFEVIDPYLIPLSRFSNLIMKLGYYFVFSNIKHLNFTGSCYSPFNPYFLKQAHIPDTAIPLWMGPLFSCNKTFAVLTLVDRLVSPPLI